MIVNIQMAVASAGVCTAMEILRVAALVGTSESLQHVLYNRIMNIIKVTHKNNSHWGVGRVVFKGTKQNHPGQLLVRWETVGCLWSYKSNLEEVK